MQMLRQPLLVSFALITISFGQGRSVRLFSQFRSEQYLFFNYQQCYHNNELK